MSTREQRRLAAIVAADVVGYSRLMGRDEAGTVARLRKVRAERLEPVLARRGGRIVKLTGDGALIEFASAVEALSAAIEFQQAMAEGEAARPEGERLVFRVGVHLGDVIVDGDDLYGDGINVAARLEAEAPAGGILVSGDMHNATAGRLKATLDDLGQLALKNIERQVQAYTVRWQEHDWPLASGTAHATNFVPRDIPLSLPDKPSIAVLPFQNMSGDPEQEYFADGIVEDIITALSRFKSLFVIARNSTFTYKGRAVDIKQVGHELGVRYVLEGSVRKAGSRVRITGQLIDSETGAHRWADRFDGSLEDIFELQDEVTGKVLSALVPTLEKAEIERAKLKPTSNLGAYDYYLRGVAAQEVLSIESNEQSMRLFEQALALDPYIAPAAGKLLACYANRRGFGVVVDADRERAEVTRLVRVTASSDDGVALARAGWTTAYVLRDLRFAKELIERALVLNPNASTTWSNSGWISLWSGDTARALEDLARGMRLDPFGSVHAGRNGLAHAHYLLGQYQEALQWAEIQLRENPHGHPGLRIGAASAALAGKTELAQKLAERLRQIDPRFRLANLESYLGPYQTSELEKLKQGLRLAGFAE